MSPADTGHTMRLPHEPYPGLRPFLDFEAALLFGRERQVREVIERLRVSQFVAVLGGSGSGKSSLIHAGVTPELRSYGIPGAGDLWLTLVCTPGTNVSEADRAARRRSPVTRLARRFNAMLRSRGSDEADAARAQEIADVFRQQAGFNRLLDTFGGELALPPGPQAADARVLFVLDQFEEIFHPTNQGVDDAQLLVERVLDHFFNPHPRCHVVITMRSEHLNDCASYLELPDAINKSSYLVRRLDEDELQQAITGPAQRFLRLMARSSDAPEKLPETVAFEPGVVERLVADTRAIAHDPDHLPLLQHLLARLWQAALERESTGLPVPAQVTAADLVGAVQARRAATRGNQDKAARDPLPADLNTLRASVDNWPASIYAQHGEAQKLQLDALFRHLGFKDPNTGLYSQQRVDVDAAAQLLGMQREGLHQLLGEGFLGNVDYLYWDDDDPARLTLKVSHESFIRGWAQFRRLIDEQSRQFDEYMLVLRRAADWTASTRAEDLLLQPGEMRRLRESGFVERLADGARRQTWSRLLRLVRDGERLGAYEAALDALVGTSNQRLQQGLQRRRTNRYVAAAVLVLALLLVPPTVFSLLVQGPVIDRAGLLFSAGNRANRAPLSEDYPGVGAASATLDSLMHAVEQVDLARTGAGSELARVSQQLIESFSWLGSISSQDRFLKGVAAQAEAPVNGKLRRLFSGAVWRAEAPGDDAVEMPAAEVIEEARCLPPPGKGPGVTLAGKLFVAQNVRGQQAVRRAILLTASSALAAGADIELRSAWVEAGGGPCRYGPIVLSIPGYLNPYLVFDAGLRYFLFAAYGDNADSASVTVNEIDWDRGDSGQLVLSEARTVITDLQAFAALVRATPRPLRAAAVRTWRVNGGRVLQVDDQFWRLVSLRAQPLKLDGAPPTTLRPLQASPANSACRRLTATWAVNQGAGAIPLFETGLGQPGGEHCFLVTRGPLQASNNRQDILVAVYDRPGAETSKTQKGNEPAPIASMGPFATLPPGGDDFHIGVAGPHAGWLMLQRGTTMLGLPYSSCALRRLGQELRLPMNDGDTVPLPDARACREAKVAR